MRAIEDVLDRNPGLQHARDIVNALALPVTLNDRAFAALQALATSGRIAREGTVRYATRKAALAVPPPDVVVSPLPSSGTRVRVKRCNVCGRAILRRATRSTDEPLTDVEQAELDAHAGGCWPSSSDAPNEAALPALWTSNAVE